MRPRPLVPVAALTMAALLLAACGGADDTPGPDDAEQVTPDDPDDDGAGGGGDPDADAGSGDQDDAPADLDEFTDLAVATAADETGVAEDEIEVVTAEEVTWPDGSHGCPEEGEMYTQALVPGYRAILDAGGEERHYHGGEGEPPFHCEDPQEPAEE